MTDKEFRSLVGEAIGEASMAWSETPSGVFKASLCRDLIDKIVDAKNEHFSSSISRVLDGFDG